MTVVEIPDGSPFGVDNLPYGVFSVAVGPPRVGTRLGDTVIDLSVVLTGARRRRVRRARAEPVHGPGARAVGRGARARSAPPSGRDLPAEAVHPLA